MIGFKNYIRGAGVMDNPLIVCTVLEEDPSLAPGIYHVSKAHNTFIKNKNESLKIYLGDTNNMTVIDCVRKIKNGSSNCWFLQLEEQQAIYSDVIFWKRD